MPNPERWELKAIGRVARHENTAIEKVANTLYEGTRSVVNAVAQFALNNAPAFLHRVIAPKDAVYIDGKRFRHNHGVGELAGRNMGDALLEAGLNVGKKGANQVLTRNFFFPTGAAVASTAFAGRVNFDVNMGVDMYNACGYQPDFQRILSGLNRTASEVGDNLNDITWRKEVTPHMIRTAFREELGRSFEAIRAQHMEAPVSNRQLVEAQMNLAAQHLSNIFQKFTLDLANNTDYLEAPMTFVPQKKVLPEIEMTAEEKKLFNDVSQHSLFSSHRELRKMISKAADKMPEANAKETKEKFDKSLASEDVEYRQMNSILNLRGLQRKYARRNIFSRYLTRAGREERATINTMKEQLKESLGIDDKALKDLLNLNTPMEDGIALKAVLGIKQKEYPAPQKTYTEEAIEVATKAKDIVVGTASMAKDIVDGTASMAKGVVAGTAGMAKAVVGAVSAGATILEGKIENMVMGDTFKDFNPFEDDDELDELFGYSPSPKKKEENVIKEEPEEESKEDAKEEAKEEAKEVKAVESVDNPLLNRVQNLQKDAAKAALDGPFEADAYKFSLAKMLYYKSLETSLKEPLEENKKKQIEAGLSESSVKSGAEQIKKAPAFKKMKFVSGATGKIWKEFMEKASGDSSVVNDAFKQYLRKEAELNNKESVVPQNKQEPTKEVAKKTDRTLNYFLN